MSDDHDYGYDDWLEREREYEREMAITEYLQDRERDEEDRRRREAER